LAKRRSKSSCTSPAAQQQNAAELHQKIKTKWKPLQDALSSGAYVERDDSTLLAGYLFSLATELMNALLLYPHFPKTFWSFDRFLEMAGVKAFIPPLGILTVASLLPPE
jgi:hypothetical protein